MLSRLITTLATGLFAFCVFAIGVLIGALLVSLPVMLLWNYIAPVVYAGAPQLGLFQAWTLVVLCGFLFKSNSK